MMHASEFHIFPGTRSGLARRLRRGIEAAAEDGRLLVLPPGDYHTDEPIEVVFNENIAHSWGVSAVGAKIIAEYTEINPIVLFDVRATVRFASIDGLSLRGKDTHHGLHIVAHGGTYFYSFILSRLTGEHCDDAIRLEGNVFEGEVTWCYGRESNAGLAFGNDDQGGVFSAVNVFGGSYSQNRGNGLRTFGPQYREPYDFSMFGTYLGNNGKYAIDAKAGFTLLKGVRLENPWNDPEDGITCAAIHMMNNGVAEQTNTGGNNGNVTTLIDGYLSGRLSLRDCKAPRTLAKVDGQSGNAFLKAIDCSGEIDATNAVVVERV